ncbi:exonuclease VIII [Maribacter phage Panino]
MTKEEATKREGIIEKFRNKTIRLSQSTLKKFDSPINLIDYKMKGFKPNAGMIFGSLCDVLLTEPKNLWVKYALIDKIPESELQLKLVDLLVPKLREDGFLEDDFIEEAYDSIYSRKGWEKTYSSIKDYVEAMALRKDVITQVLLDEAIEVTERFKEHPMIASMLEKVTDSQVEMKWKDKGWDFIAFLDYLVGEDNIIDLKYTKDANPEKFTRDVYNLKYYFQGAAYCRGAQLSGLCDNPSFTLIAYDKSGNFSIVKLDYSYIAYGTRELDYLLENLDRCVEEDAWDKSYDFFKPVYTAYKPKWAKGFELEKEK